MIRKMYQQKNNSLRMIMKFDCRTQVKESFLDAERAADDRKSHYEQVVLMISDILWRYDLGLNGEHVDSYISPVADRMLNLPDGTIKDSFDKFFPMFIPMTCQPSRVRFQTQYECKEWTRAWNIVCERQTAL